MLGVECVDNILFGTEVRPGVAAASLFYRLVGAVCRAWSAQAAPSAAQRCGPSSPLSVGLADGWAGLVVALRSLRMAWFRTSAAPHLLPLLLHPADCSLAPCLAQLRAGADAEPPQHRQPAQECGDQGKHSRRSSCPDVANSLLEAVVAQLACIVGCAAASAS